jgi:hypothetical protein
MGNTQSPIARRGTYWSTGSRAHPHDNCELAERQAARTDNEIK